MVEYIAIAVVVIVLVIVVILAAKRCCSKRSCKPGKSKNKGKSSSQSAYSGPANTQLYIGNISYRASESELEDFFAGFGEIDTIRVIKDRRTGRSKGFAFITYVELEGASEALTAHEQDFMGRALIVRYAKPAAR